MDGFLPVSPDESTTVVAHAPCWDYPVEYRKSYSHRAVKMSDMKHTIMIHG